MTRMPAVQEKVKELTGKEPHRGVNPDEVVADRRRHPGRRARRRRQGRPAARRDPADARHRDQGRRHDEAHRAQHHDPDAQGRDLLDRRGQPAVGGDPRPAGRARDGRSYNKSLGKFQLTGIPPAPRGIPQIEVAFDIDANGILNVSAKDLGTGKEQKIEIKSGSGLTDDEIKKMVSDAETHADEDRKRLRELAEARNNGENAAYQAERQLKDLEENSRRGLEDRDRGADQGPARVAGVRGRRARSRQDRGAADRVPQGLRGDVREGPQRRSRRARLGQRRRRPDGEPPDGEEDVVDAEVVDEGR